MAAAPCLVALPAQASASTIYVSLSASSSHHNSSCADAKYSSIQAAADAVAVRFLSNIANNNPGGCGIVLADHTGVGSYLGDVRKLSIRVSGNTFRNSLTTASSRPVR